MNIYFKLFVMSRAILIGFCFMHFGFTSASQSKFSIYPEIGDSVLHYKKLSKPYRLITGNASGITVIDYVVDGIKYSIGDYMGKVFFIYTKDSKFRSPEQIYVGEYLKKVLLVDSKFKVSDKYQGNYEVRLKSGWVAHFETNDSLAVLKYFTK